MPWYEFTCAAPECGRHKRTYRQLNQKPPIYCSRDCGRRYANWRKIKDRERVWRKYRFDTAMDEAVRLASRRYGGLKHLWQTDPRFEGAGIPYAIVKRQALLLGCVHRVEQQPWRPEEDAIIHEARVSCQAPETIAKRLARAGYHRSPGAVWQRMHALGENGRRGEYTLLDVAQGLGVDPERVERWIRLGSLRASRTSPQPKARTYVQQRALMKFLRTYPAELHRAQPDLVWLIGLLTAPHPIGDTARTPPPTRGDRLCRDVLTPPSPICPCASSPATTPWPWTPPCTTWRW